MVNNIAMKRHLDRWVYLFITLHVLAWTLAPSLVRYTLPMDALEGTTWGHQLEWGYDKNPFMNGWLTALAVWIGNHSDWVIYFFSQISVGVCMWAVWRLGKQILPPIYALLAVIMLEANQYFNFHAIDFNDNTLELSLWALTILFFYQAMRNPNYRNWIFTGLFAGLGMMAKYYTALLLLSLGLFLLFNKESRQQFKKPGLYLACVVFLIVIIPHTIWLFFHDFVTINYAVNRVSNATTWTTHFDNAIQFAWQQIEVFLPVLLLYLFLIIGKRPLLESKKSTLTVFNNRFLLFAGMGPFIITILLSAVTGMKLRAGWGQPLLSLWSLMLLAWLMPHLTRARLQRFIIAAVIFFIAIVTAYCVALTRASEPSSANFPGKKIATELTQEWQQRYHTPLHYVAGPRWIAGNVAYYSSDHPAVYMEWNRVFSPWIDEVELNRQGAIFIWDEEPGENAVQQLKKRFGRMQMMQTKHYSWMRNDGMKPVMIYVIFVKPQ